MLLSRNVKVRNVAFNQDCHITPFHTREDGVGSFVSVNGVFMYGERKIWSDSSFLQEKNIGLVLINEISLQDDTKSHTAHARLNNIELEKRINHYGYLES
ncbi:hypothetical protein TNCT_498781 [Trichonephila clavata]|uniref:Uncharacterized protein n=1 Tax=Trichonephila clavata TaxID=2740835 RepID=A0A8X6I1B1_TRICU|nr:hypothetical protein TNCT_498781 [Trichonephila clavata]